MTKMAPSLNFEKETGTGQPPPHPAPYIKAEEIFSAIVTPNTFLLYYRAEHWTG